VAILQQTAYIDVPWSEAATENYVYWSVDVINCFFILVLVPLMVLSTPAQASSPLKRKHTLDDDVGPSTKKPKKDRKHKHKLAQRDEFALVEASLVVSIPPVFASNPAQGVEEMLDSMIMR
jgi:hypothetical protein